MCALKEVWAGSPGAHLLLPGVLSCPMHRGCKKHSGHWSICISLGRGDVGTAPERNRGVSWGHVDVHGFVCVQVGLELLGICFIRLLRNLRVSINILYPLLWFVDCLADTDPEYIVH